MATNIEQRKWKDEEGIWRLLDKKTKESQTAPEPDSEGTFEEDESEEKQDEGHNTNADEETLTWLKPTSKQKTRRLEPTPKQKALVTKTPEEKAKPRPTKRPEFKGNLTMPASEVKGDQGGKTSFQRHSLDQHCQQQTSQSTMDQAMGKTEPSCQDVLYTMATKRTATAHGFRTKRTRRTAVAGRV